MENNDTLIKNIEKTIDKEIKPFIEADGGKIKLKKFEEGIVYVKLSGACSHCYMVNMTLKDGVQRILQDKYPEVKSVELA